MLVLIPTLEPNQKTEKYTVRERQLTTFFCTVEIMPAEAGRNKFSRATCQNKDNIQINSAIETYNFRLALFNHYIEEIFLQYGPHASLITYLHTYCTCFTRDWIWVDARTPNSPGWLWPCSPGKKAPSRWITEALHRWSFRRTIHCQWMVPLGRLFLMLKCVGGVGNQLRFSSYGALQKEVVGCLNWRFWRQVWPHG